MGCSFYSKDDYIKDFTALVSEMETDYKNYTNENWEEKNAEYQQYIVEYYEQFKDELTDEDQHAIGKLKGRYFIVMLKYEAGKVVNEIQEGYKQLGGVIEGISETVKME